MRYFRIAQGKSGNRLLAEKNGTAYDLTEANPDLTSFRSLSQAATIVDESVDTVASHHLANAEEVALDDDHDFCLPLVPAEVWAAGVTYSISEEARESESGMPEMYIDVYESERPEIFFKATPSRTVGPTEEIGIRGDSNWNVPEPELGIVLYRGDIVGYTVGNDVSSRAIEGANPLYLPQAKVYERCCALGPCVASPETVGDPHNLEIAMRIKRKDEVVFDGMTSTAKMVRHCDDLVSYLTRHNDIPDLVVLMTGTSLVPDDNFTLSAGDHVRIDIENIGTLYNSVITV